MMSFRDDFNTLDTNVWEIVSTLPSGNSVDVYNGYLRINLDLDRDQHGVIGIRRIGAFDLIGKRIVFTPLFTRDYSYIQANFGVIVTNAPYEQQPSYLRGFGYFLRGHGTLLKELATWYIYGTTLGIGVIPCYEYPPKLVIDISPNGAYIYLGDNPIDYRMVTFDAKNSYLQLFADVTADETDTTQLLADYVEVSSVVIPETTPYLSAGATAEMPIFPPGTLPTLFSALMTPLVGNAFVSMAEGIRKPPPKGR